jgi:DNA-binding NarL/FixJ family response regulator
MPDHSMGADHEHANFLLTPRERGVVQLIAEGYGNKQVASC